MEHEEIDPIINKGEKNAKIFEQKALGRKLAGMLVTESVGLPINQRDLTYYIRKMQEAKSSWIASLATG